MSEARTQFKKGDRVKPSAEALKSFSRMTAAQRATVTGISRDGEVIYIKKEGQKSKQSYHKDFWERADQ